VDFSTELIKLMPFKYQTKQPWIDFFQAFGTVLNGVHEKIDGLADLKDPDNIPAEYMPYFAELYGVSLVVKPGTEDEGRRRQILKSINNIIKAKGLSSLIENIIEYLYFKGAAASAPEIIQLYTSDYVTFSVQDLLNTETPAGWVGDGATAAYAIASVAQAPVRVRSVKITTVATDDTELEVWDDGKGALRGDVTTPGTINYTTGALSLIFNKDVKLGENIVVLYIEEAGQYLSPHYALYFPEDVYSVLGAIDKSETPAGWTGDGVTAQYAATLSWQPIQILSVTITATDIYDDIMTVTDDGAGELTGNVGSGNNSIDYTTGAVDVTFDAPVKAGSAITVVYVYQDLYRGRDTFLDMMAYMDRYRPVHTVVRTEIGRPDDFWQVDEIHGVVDGAGSPVVPSVDEIIIGGSIWQ
jgi:hypothetical protein